MSTILLISLILILISIGASYLSYLSFIKTYSDEAKIINEIMVKYTNNLRYYA